jgi:hypothetical protein
MEVASRELAFTASLTIPAKTDSSKAGVYHKIFSHSKRLSIVMLKTKSVNQYKFWYLQDNFFNCYVEKIFDLISKMMITHYTENYMFNCTVFAPLSKPFAGIG